MNKTIITTICIAFISNVLFAQQIEFCGSLNTSTEPRLQNAVGIGLQYQQDITLYYKIGVGLHYSFDKTTFVDDPYTDNHGPSLYADKINSHSHRTSLRINVQRILKENEHVSLSLGAEFSNNYIWGTDANNYLLNPVDTVLKNKTVLFRNNKAKDIGLGIISKIEIKEFIIQPLSLCFTIRPEILLGQAPIIGRSADSVFKEFMGFTEFQIGLLYTFKKI